MGTLADFLGGIFDDGRARLDAPPWLDGSARAGAAEVLGRAFARHRLDVAGPAIEFDGPAAMAAAEFARLACWFLLDRSGPPEALASRLAIPPAPRSAAEHLSSDLTLRLLPPVARRARALGPGDPLGPILADAFRRFPLSGVLSGVEAGPGGPGDLGGHPGLALLYAERLARPGSGPGWAPAAGSVVAAAAERIAARASRGGVG